MNPPLSILHLYKTYHPVLGGIEGHLRLLARGQASRGHNVTVLVTGSGPTRIDLEDGVRVIRCRRLAELRSMPLSIAFCARLHREVADVIHLQVPFPLGEIAHAIGGRATASIATYQSDIVRQRFFGALYRPLLVRLLRRMDRVLVTSENYLGSSPVLGRVCSAGNCSVVPLGIDLAVFASSDRERVEELRRRFGGPIVLFVGRLRAYKGVTDLIEAMALVTDRPDTPDASLVVVGRGPEQSNLERTVAARGLGSRCHLLGDVDAHHLGALYAAADVAVLPSRYRSEAFGLVLVEAMAAGTPVISTELGTGTSWVNIDGETGLVVAPRAPDQLARAISDLIEDSELRRKMGERARLRVERYFDGERQIDRIVEIYRQVLAEKEAGLES